MLPPLPPVPRPPKEGVKDKKRNETKEKRERDKPANLHQAQLQKNVSLIHFSRWFRFFWSCAFCASWIL